MVGGRLPDVPDPTKIAGAGAEIAKAMATGGVAVSSDIAEGVRKLVTLTVEGSATEADRLAKGIISIIKANLDTGKVTVESVRRDIDTALNSVKSQVDQAVGGEIVRKFKSEIEGQLR